MDFVTTTPFNSSSAEHQYKRPPKRTLFVDYKPESLKSALYTEARQRINDIRDEMQKRVGTVESLVATFMGATVTAVAILIAVLAFFVAPERKTLPLWVSVNLALSGLALFFLFLILLAVKSQDKK